MLAVWHGNFFLDEIAREINHARGRLQVSWWKRVCE
jgi:hypothetical protein